MIVKRLYKYMRPEGGITASLIKYDEPHTTSYRVIAQPGKMLSTSDGQLFSVLDTDNPYDLIEVDAPAEDDNYA